MRLNARSRAAALVLLAATACSGGDGAELTRETAPPSGQPAASFCDGFERPPADVLDVATDARPLAEDTARGLSAHRHHVTALAEVAPAELDDDFDLLARYLDAVVDLFEAHAFDVERLVAEAAADDLEAIEAMGADGALASIASYVETRCR